MDIKPVVPNRPAISDVLIKASANGVFRAKLLNSPNEALVGFEIPPEDVDILTAVQASNLREYAHQIKLRLLYGCSPLN